MFARLGRLQIGWAHRSEIRRKLLDLGSLRLAVWKRRQNPQD
jgi:hypothetical protein